MQYYFKDGFQIKFIGKQIKGKGSSIWRFREKKCFFSRILSLLGFQVRYGDVFLVLQFYIGKHLSSFTNIKHIKYHTQGL